LGKASFDGEQVFCKEDGFPLVEVENFFKCSRSHIDENIGSRRLAALEYDHTTKRIHFIFENGAILPVDMYAVQNMFYDSTFREEYGPTFSDENVDHRLHEKEQALQHIIGRRIVDSKVLAGIDPSYAEEIFILLDDDSTLRLVTTQLHENSLQIRTYEEDDPMVPAGVQILHEDRRYWDELTEMEHSM
jgi:hypothetical protein